ncbi:hypothetical protein BH09MYX1_BH09MYX1_02500 [soil metagenome]
MELACLVPVFASVLVAAACSHESAPPTSAAGGVRDVDAASLDAASFDASEARDAGEPPTADASGNAPALEAWFLLAPIKCTQAGSAYGICYKVTLSLRGAVREDRVVARSHWSQLGCSGGANVECNGPSGSSHIFVRCDAKGECFVEQKSGSDGYCPANDCDSTLVVDHFSVAPATKVKFEKP